MLFSFSGIPEGGLVPKSYYMSPQDFEKDQSPGPHLTDSSCYQSISLNKSQVGAACLYFSNKETRRQDGEAGKSVRATLPPAFEFAIFDPFIHRRFNCMSVFT